MKLRFALIASLSVISGLSLPTAAAVLERVIAKVNGEIITLSEFEERQVATLQAEGVTSDRIEAFLQQRSGEILQEAIDDVLLGQKAEELGIRVRPDALDQVIEDIKKENKIASDDDFRAQLAREGLTLEGLRRNIGRSISKRRVVTREIESKVTVTEGEIRAEYDGRPRDFQRPASVRLQEIVLSSDSAAARTQAAELVTRSKGGEDFAEIARRHSTSATREAGGDLGWVAVDELHPALLQSIASLAPGQVSEPVAIAGAIRILKVNERTEARTVPYEEAREQIARRLRQERLAAAYDRYVAELRKEAVIDLRVREVPSTLTVPTASEPGFLRDSTLPDDGIAPPAP
jgi:parvulin-like peptidyl-prolyl isomerase